MGMVIAKLHITKIAFGNSALKMSVKAFCSSKPT